MSFAVLITDDSDDNWWKGSNHRGEGLFPANFVSTDMKAESEEPQRRRSVQFNEQVEIKTLKDDEAEVAAAAAALGPVEISEEKIDRVLYLLNDSDPTTVSYKIHFCRWLDIPSVADGLGRHYYVSQLHSFISDGQRRPRVERA
jgi:hypothetical protein